MRVIVTVRGGFSGLHLAPPTGMSKFHRCALVLLTWLACTDHTPTSSTPTTSPTNLIAPAPTDDALESFPLFRIDAPPDAALTQVHVGPRFQQTFVAPESLRLSSIYVCFQDKAGATEATIQDDQATQLATVTTIEATDVRCSSYNSATAGYWFRLVFGDIALARAHTYSLSLTAPADAPMALVSSLVDRYPHGALSGATVDALTTLSYTSTDNPRLAAAAVATPEPIPAVVDGPLVGTTDGEASVTDTGAASYRIEIQTPPGTLGVQPKLSLSYDSHDGNGQLGVGWSLRGLSRIHRCAATLAQDGFIDGVDFDHNDRLCLDGQRLVPTGETTEGREYRTENETFTRIVAVGGDARTAFRTWTKSGEIREYGFTEDAKIEAQGKSDVLFWNLNRVQDRMGNYMTFAYEEDNPAGESHIARIDYTGNDNADLKPYASVRFEYDVGVRSDHGVEFTAGSQTSVTRRLRRITSYSGDDIAFDYRLTYESGPASNRTRLASVEQCDATETCLPATSFTWTDTSDRSWVAAPLYASPTILDPEGHDPRFVDLNGDGLRDLVVPKSSAWINDGTTWVSAPDFVTPSADVEFIDLNGDNVLDIIAKHATDPANSPNPAAWINDGTTWAAAPHYNPPIRLKYTPGVPSRRIHYADIDGNGLMDIVDPGTSTWLNNGTQWVESTNYLTPTDTYGVRFADVNGDGLVDLMEGRQADRNSASEALHTWLNNGNTWEPAPHLTPPAHFMFLSNERNGNYGVMFPDLNNDGIQDMVRHFRSFEGWDIIKDAWISDGDKWIITDSYTPPFAIHQNGGAIGAHIRITDVNGDGLPDWLSGYWNNNRHTWLNSGSGWTEAAHYASPTRIISRAVHLVDLNGDGFEDIVKRTKLGHAVERPQGAWINTGSPPDLLARVTTALGDQVEFNYEPMTSKDVYTRGQGAQFPVVDVQGPRWLVATLRRNNGVGGFDATSYHYQGLRHHRHGFGSLGFAKTTRTHASGLKVISEYSQDFERRLQGRLVRERTVSPTGVELVDAIHTLESKQYGSGKTTRFYSFTKSVKTTQRALTGTIKGTELDTTALSDDEFGNVTRTTRTTTDASGTHVKTTTHTYDNDPTSWTLARLTGTSVTYEAPNVPAQTRTLAYGYDADTGQRNLEVIEPDSEFSYQVSYRFHPLGTRSEAVETWAGQDTDNLDFTEKRTQTTFDDTGRFPIFETNALNQAKRATYVSELGVAHKRVDPNGNVTMWSYDRLGRVIQEMAPSGSKATTSYLWCAGVHDGTEPCPAGAYYVTKVQNDASPDRRVYFDSLAREIQTEVQAFDGRMIVREIQYDRFGRISHVSDPYFANQEERANEEDSEVQWIHTEYDILDRPTQITYPGNVVSRTDHNGLEVVATNALMQTKTMRTNLLGQLLEVVDSIGNTTNYTYDAVGNLTSVRDPVGHVKRWTYDARDRKTSTTDPDFGYRQFRYNALGHMIEQTDTKQQVIRSFYDELGRVSRRVDDATGPNPTTSYFRYDTTTPGIGRLGTVEQRDAENIVSYQQTLRYDELGRPVSKRSYIDGEIHTIHTGYDQHGRVASTQYPDGLLVEHVYNEFGVATATRNGNTQKEYWRLDDTNARGAHTAITLGNGIATTHAYDKNTGRLGGITSHLNDAVIRQLAMGYDKLGNLTTRHDVPNDIMETYTYDDLNRLSTITIEENTSTITYDNQGNIQFKPETGSYSYGQACDDIVPGPHAVTSVGAPLNASFCYDENGNMTSGDGRTLQYDVHNKPTLITSGVEFTGFVYGPGRERISRVDSGPAGTSTRFYVDNYERVQTGTAIEHVYQLGHAIITRTATGEHTHYLHRDQLGSIVAISDESGAIVRQYDYDAWGKPGALAGLRSDHRDITNHGFTDHEHIGSAGLIHMNGRVYEPNLGRFLSPDPFVQDTTNLQNLNRYSYVLNSPLRYVDPTGFRSLLVDHWGDNSNGLWGAIKGSVSRAFNRAKSGLQRFGGFVGGFASRNLRRAHELAVGTGNALAAKVRNRNDLPVVYFEPMTVTAKRDTKETDQQAINRFDRAMGGFAERLLMGISESHLRNTQTVLDSLQGETRKFFGKRVSFQTDGDIKLNSSIAGVKYNLESGEFISELDLEFLTLQNSDAGYFSVEFKTPRARDRVKAGVNVRGSTRVLEWGGFMDEIITAIEHRHWDLYDGYDFGYTINPLFNPTNPRGTNYTRRFYPEQP